MMFGQPNQLPEDDPDAIESKDFKEACKVSPSLQGCNVGPKDRGVHREPSRKT